MTEMHKHTKIFWPPEVVCHRYVQHASQECVPTASAVRMLMATDRTLSTPVQHGHGEKPLWVFGPQRLPVVTADWFGLLVRVRGRQPDGETERGGDLWIDGLLRFVCFLLHSLNLEHRVPDFICMSAQAKLFRHNKKQQIRYCHVCDSTMNRPHTHLNSLHWASQHPSSETLDK